MKERIKSFEWKYVTLLSLFLSFTLFFFGPLEILSGIWADVWFDVTHIMGLILLLFSTCFLALWLGGFVCNMVFPRLFFWYETVLFAVALSFYIQGNFLKSDYGSLDGNSIDWSVYRIDGFISIAVWVVLIFGILIWAKKKGYKSFKYGSKLVMTFILLIQIVTLGTLSFTSDMLSVKDNPEYSTENEFIYSKEDNMIILVLDAYDSQVFNYILENPEEVNYVKMFENFTYYPNTVSAFSRTYYAIPQMLTGESYKNEGSFDEYLNEAYRKSPFFNELQKQNYSINLYTNEGFPTEADVYGMIENYIPEGENRIQISSKRRMMGYLIKLVGIRYLPQPLKQYVWFYSGELYDVRELDDHQEVYSVDNHNFLWDSEDMVSTADTNTFHFYHVEGVHSPYYFDRYFRKTGKKLFDKESMIEAGRGILVMVQQYMDELKSLGVYDNSVIVIMADHGGGWMEDRDTLLCRHNPLLLVKGRKERHEFTISKAPISYEDLQAAYVNLLNGSTGKDVFEARDGEQRKRIYINDSDFVEYATEEDAFNYDALQPTGIVYEP